MEGARDNEWRGVSETGSKGTAQRVFNMSCSLTFNDWAPELVSLPVVNSALSMFSGVPSRDRFRRLSPFSQESSW